VSHDAHDVYMLLTKISNNLVNGKANYPCANTTLPCTPNAGLTKFAFQSGKKYRMRLINPSSDALQKISIDNHTFTVIAYDFTPIQPYQTDLITLAVGQRADVIIEATGSPTGSYWFRSTLGVGSDACSLPDGISPNAMAVVYYQNANANTVPNTTSGISTSRITNCANDALSSTVPLFTKPGNATGQLLTQKFNIDFINNGTNYLWTMNNVSARVDYNVAQLQQAVQGTLNPPTEW
jgi:Multicopper oxidase